jgi:AcrR family transcriptional regulator
LLQERSRRTRQRLIRAALDLWAQRGFETGIEETTIEEIVAAAGVTKGTFYFHFARKEEILLEMGWRTAEVVYAEAEACVRQGRNLNDSLARVLGVLARRIEAAPKAAVARAVSQMYQFLADEAAGPGRLSFSAAFKVVFAAAVEAGELPSDTDPVELAEMLQSLSMSSVMEWAVGQEDLLPSLRSRATLLTTGVFSVA